METGIYRTILEISNFIINLEDLRYRNDDRKLVEIETIINIIQAQFKQLDEQTEAAMKIIKSIQR